MPLRSLPNRHYFDRDPTEEHPAVRLYPEIAWRGTPARWVRDIGEDIDMPTVGIFNRGQSHFLDESRLFNDECDICKDRKAFRYDDFFGYVCTLCEIKHPLRFKARGVNPWSGKVNP